MIGSVVGGMMINHFQKLGSSAGIPAKDRGVTSLMVRTDRYDIMFDCGEGTYLKWIESGYKWRRLKYILITHMHPDHTGGLIPLIFYRNILRIEPPLILYGPSNLEEFVLDSCKHQDVNLKFDIDFNSIEEMPEFMLDDDIFVKTVELEHKVKCFGYRIEDESNSVAFMTDTLPIDQTIEFALDVDHFIHEATFLDEHIDLSEETKHTTFSQAVKLGGVSQAGQNYLTHFSPRIKDQEIEDLEKEHNFISLHRAQKVILC